MPKQIKKTPPTRQILPTSFILIDGSNFYFKCKNLGLKHLSILNFSAFTKLISRNSKPIIQTYYIGAIKASRTKKSKALHAHQQRLLSHLHKHNSRYSLDYLLKSNHKYHEKGVDVAMAVDILIAAYEKQVDNIILVSSDTDLLPAIRKARSLSVTIEYVGFSHQPSLALIANCNSSKLLTREELEPFTK